MGKIDPKTGLDSAAKQCYIVSQVKTKKPMKQSSKRSSELTESRRRWDGGREDPTEWTAEGG